MGPEGDHRKPIPSPKCFDKPDGNTRFVNIDEASNAISLFCGNKAHWNTDLVSPVSMATGQNKALGVSDSYTVNDGKDKLYLQVAFSEEGDCVGESAFTTGKTDEEKMTFCTMRFERILHRVNATSRWDPRSNASPERACAN